MEKRVVHELLRAWVAEKPEAPFLKCTQPTPSAGTGTQPTPSAGTGGGDGWLSYREVDERSDRLAAGLAGLGLAKGDRLAVILPNREEFFAIMFACSKLGLIQVPLNTFLKGEFLSHQLVDSGAKALIADAEGLAAAEPLLAQTDIATIIATDEASGDQHRFSDVAATPGPPPQVEVSPHDISCIIYTSGTTGMSKGCMLSHGYVTMIPKAYATAEWVKPGDRIYSPFPLFHTSGQAIVVMCALHLGESAELTTSFRASTFIDEAQEAGATMLFGIGAMALALLAQPEKPEQAECKFRLASWIPMRPDLQAEFERRFGTPVICEGFGQTECAPATLNPVGGDRRPATAGKEVAHLEVKILDAEDNECAAGEVGEICIRPREPGGLFSGYWGNPDATVATFRNLWHHTGDSARADEDGYITFVDRKKDSMRRRGENVSSLELEMAILKHDKVQQVAVHAVPSEMSEDDIKACIVPADGDPPTAEELFAHFKDNLPYYAVPRYVQLRESLPANAMGRVMKHVLRATPITDDTWDLEAMGLVVGKDGRR